MYAPKLTFGNEILRKTHEFAMKLDTGNNSGQNGTVVGREASKAPSLHMKAVAVLQDQSRTNVKVVYLYEVLLCT